ncbi:hypothetical protein SLEP1_g20551 [Rubroshorea leprosula]|uniref:Uncharacterized protein n=1 Tax=Rubroshorea leprosula TaxID=152421 RepID=A0AAV5JDQ0_9ROSI|nr:hypothetical protein SLEP1_g20551 [Rubroshorea leprosula]
MLPPMVKMLVMTYEVPCLFVGIVCIKRHGNIGAYSLQLKVGCFQLSSTLNHLRYGKVSS